MEIQWKSYGSPMEDPDDFNGSSMENNGNPMSDPPKLRGPSSRSSSEAPLSQFPEKVIGRI